jgi:hypothetical protein
MTSVTRTPNIFVGCAQHPHLTTLAQYNDHYGPDAPFYYGRCIYCLMERTVCEYEADGESRYEIISNASRIMNVGFRDARDGVVFEPPLHDREGDIVFEMYNMGRSLWTKQEVRKKYHITGYDAFCGEREMNDEHDDHLSAWTNLSVMQRQIYEQKCEDV